MRWEYVETNWLDAFCFMQLSCILIRSHQRWYSNAHSRCREMGGAATIFDHYMLFIHLRWTNRWKTDARFSMEIGHFCNITLWWILGPISSVSHFIRASRLIKTRQHGIQSEIQSETLRFDRRLFCRPPQVCGGLPLQAPAIDSFRPLFSRPELLYFPHSEMPVAWVTEMLG